MSIIDYLAQRQQEYQAQYDQLTARIEAVQKDLGRALDSEQKLVLEQRLQDVTVERERVVEQLAFLEQHADDIRAGKLELPGLTEIEPVPGPTPYKGLQYFDVTDAPYFFGREALTAELVGYLKNHSLLAVVGASGSGKSSLVRAGLIPALQQGKPLTGGTHPPKGSERWFVHVITPTSKPLESLAASLTRDSESVMATANLIDDLGKDPRSLYLYARRLLSQPGAGDHLLLVVDQFEELFTLCKDRAQRKAFVDTLLTAACPEEGAPCNLTQSVVSVVWTLRADFYPHCAEFENLRAALQDYQRYIGALSQEELRRVIEEPAKRGGWELEPGLVKVLLQDVGDEPGALPLLSHALLETWKRRRGRRLTLAGYAASGQVQGAIAKTADDVYDHDLTPEQQAIARNIFLRLTELGEGAQDTRRRVTLSELIPEDESAEGVQVVLQKLADRRLVTTYEGEAEVAHEALIREWPRLRAWLEEDREALRVQRLLGKAAHEWEANGRDDSYLYRGARLAEAEEWNKTHTSGLNQLEAKFLEVSLAFRDREAEEKRLAEAEHLRAEEQAAVAIGMRRRALMAVAIGIVAMLAAIAAGALWFQAQKQTQLAEDRTELAKLMLAVQRDFLGQLENRRLTASMLDQQRQRLAQGQSVLDSNIVPQPAKVPDLIGVNYTDAQQKLDQACEPQPCLRVQLQWQTNDEQASGLVLRSEPPLGTELLWGAPVTLTLSQGAPKIIEQPVSMELVPVPAGAFLMGSDTWADSSASLDELPQRLVNLAEFYIGKYEVTNAQYAAFVKATGYLAPDGWESGMVPAGKEDHPAVDVSWDDAVAFTEWLGEESGTAFRLCNEAEWEKACRGTSGLIYPWGDTFDSKKATTVESGILATTSVDTNSPGGDSPYGVSDMAGNAWEWVADWYEETYYAISPADNPQGPETSDHRVLRGGSFPFNEGFARCASRGSLFPDQHFVNGGLRVCVSPGLSASPRSTTP